MSCLGRAYAILLVALLALSSLIMVESANAQSIPKPAVPQFLIQYVDYSYDIPAYSSTDPFTGQQIQHPSQHIGDIRLEGKIENQPFIPYNLPNPPNGSISEKVGFYYNVRYKGHFGSEWIEIYGYNNKDFIPQNYSSQYTNFTIKWQEFPEGAQIDYQVKALIGFEGRTWIGPYPKPIIIGEESDWSNTLTLFFTKNETAISFASNIDSIPYPVLPTPSHSLAPSPSPTVPEFPVQALLLLFVIVPLIAVAVIKRSNGLDG